MTIVRVIDFFVMALISHLNKLENKQVYTTEIQCYGKKSDLRYSGIGRNKINNML
ncbi:hypothetical protein SAMN03080602_02924 [Arenibacter troitsensis]|uniref:Uncharacterized protein n=1 Tax=Arenibacter troitsensis TaxID=188872 RepID=A0A1X7KHT9_9FLAO|nr:hypothetical protein SAMN03080602_02924 [Arenibacter troitsensis]